MIDEINELFESSTIKPTFETVHIILALYIFDDNPEGIGRYRLKNDLGIGSGTARSLITKLNTKVNFISVGNDENKRKGHTLTQKGKDFLNKVKKKISLIEKGDLSVLSNIIIESQNTKSFYCLIKNAADHITNGMAQRDAAIRIDGLGASCLSFNGEKLIFKLSVPSEEDKNQMAVDNIVQNYFKKELSERSLSLEKNDVIIIGLGESDVKARLATLNAALTLI